MLFGLLGRGESRVEAAFGRHVHWGYWPEPDRARLDPEGFPAAAERMCREVYEAAGIGDGRSVLDVGCGFGGTIASIDERFTRMNLVGLNIDTMQLERARGQVVPHNGNDIAFVAGDASRLPFAAESFDSVLAVEAIFHFPDRAAFFAEAQRVLKPGGMLAVSDFVPAAWFLPERWLNVAGRYYGDCDMRCSLPMYRRIARDVGLQPVTERDITANTLPTFDFLESLQPLMAEFGKVAARETSLLRWMSQLRVLRYTILAYRKP